MDNSYSLIRSISFITFIVDECTCEDVRYYGQYSLGKGSWNK